MYSPSKTFYYKGSININFEERGHGKTPIILLHGFGNSLNTWDEIKENFDPTIYTLFLIDLNGFGFSNKKKGDFSSKTQTDILREFIENYNISNPYIIGHSYGGSISISMILENLLSKKKCKIKGVILIDPAIYLENNPFFFKVLKNPVLSFISYHFISPKTNAEIVIRKTFFNKRKMLKKMIPRYEFFYKLNYANDAMVKTAKNAIPKNYQQTFSLLNKIKIPILIIWGENDELIPLENAFRLQKDLGNSKLKIVEKCGHVPHEEKPELTFELIEEFINSLQLKKKELI